MRETEFEHIRENINPNYAHLSDRNIEALLERHNIEAEAMEGFFDDLGKFAKSAGKAVLSAAPSVLPVAGTVLGTAFGGPLGAAIGGKLGSLAGGALGTATGQGPSGPAPGAPALPGSPAAGQLLQTILRPETLQALMSMAMGPLGRPNIPVKGTPVPVGAFSNLLGVLANQAASEYNESLAPRNSGVPEYMEDYAGEARGDPAVSEHRAQALYELLGSGNRNRKVPKAPKAWTPNTWKAKWTRSTRNTMRPNFWRSITEPKTSNTVSEHERTVAGISCRPRGRIWESDGCGYPGPDAPQRRWPKRPGRGRAAARG